MTPEAHLNDAVPKRFRGLDRFVARKCVEFFDAGFDIVTCGFFASIN